MSFALSLHGVHPSATAVIRRSPSTGASVEVRTMQLAPDETHAVSTFLAGYGPRDNRGRRRVRLRDGGELEVDESSDRAGEDGWWRLTFDRELPALSDAAFAFLFELAAVGTFVIEADVLSLVTSPRAKLLYAEAELVGSAAALRTRMQDG